LRIIFFIFCVDIIYGMGLYGITKSSNEEIFKMTNVYKEPKDYAAQVRSMGFTKEEFYDHLIELKMPAQYIHECMTNWGE